MRAIREFLDTVWVDPWTEGHIERIWAGFGSRLPDIADANWRDWKKSLDTGVDPDNMPHARRIKRRLPSDVRGVAVGHLRRNYRAVLDEQRRLGLAPDQKPAERNRAAIRAIQSEAADARKITRGLRHLRRMPVDHTYTFHGQSMYHGSITHYFDPASPRSTKTWSTLKEVHDQATQVLFDITEQSPVLFGALKQDRLGLLMGNFAFADVVGEALGDDPASVGARIVLDELKDDILDTQIKVDARTLDWQELRPVINQLMTGKQQGPSRTDWSHRFYKSLVEDEVGDYETIENLKDMGIGLVAAAFFLFAGLAPVGAATGLFLGLGAGTSALNVGRKYNTYQELDQAARAAVDREGQIVSDEQAKAAHRALVIEALFAATDLFGGLKTVRSALKGAETIGAGAKAAGAAASGLEEVRHLPAGEAGDRVLAGIRELGVHTTVKKTGMPVEELLEKLGEASPAATIQIRRALGLATELGTAFADEGQILKAIKEVASGGTARTAAGEVVPVETLLALAVDKVRYPQIVEAAGGWKKLANIVDPASDAARRINAWRGQVYEDLQRFVETLRQEGDPDVLVKATGTIKDMTNDLDMSFLGPNASANRTKALQWLAGRTGLSPDAKVLDKQLYIGLFTDPRRMHLYDMLPSGSELVAKKTAAFEQELIWNDLYHQALKANPVKAQRILDDMEQLGIRVIDRFKPLSTRQVRVLSAELDRLHGRLAKIVADPQRVEEATRLAEQIANIQAQINLKEGGGYFSGGGVRRWVSERDAFPGYAAAERPIPGASAAVGAASDQFHKLHKAVDALDGLDAVPTTVDPAKLAAVIKDVGKYGDRFMEAAGQLGETVWRGDEWNELAVEFSDLIARARTGAVRETIQENAEGVIAKAKWLLDDLDKAYVGIIRKLQQRAGLDDAKALGALIQRATLNHYRLVRFKAAFIPALKLAMRVIGKKATKTAAAEAGEPVR